MVSDGSGGSRAKSSSSHHYHAVVIKQPCVCKWVTAEFTKNNVSQLIYNNLSAIINNSYLWEHTQTPPSLQYFTLLQLHRWEIHSNPSHRITVMDAPKTMNQIGANNNCLMGSRFPPYHPLVGGGRGRKHRNNIVSDYWA